MSGGKTLIYSPGVKVLIDTLSHGIVDVTEDIVDGDLNLRENTPSTFTCTLLNHNRKYDGIFTPNDVIHVQMKRVAWLPVFSGFLGEVPYASVYPRVIRVSAEDTLKRLKMKVWDPGTQEASAILYPDQGAREQVDGGLRDRAIRVLTQVANWPQDKIHIGQIPNDWVKKIEPLKASLDILGVNPLYLGPGGSVAGGSLLDRGLRTVTPQGAGTGVLSSTSGRANYTSTNKIFELTSPERSGPGRPGSSNGPKDTFHITMRWPYRNQNGSNSLTPAEVTNAKNWWKKQKILVVNATTNQGVVCRVVDWGPNQTEQDQATGGYIAHLSRDVMGMLSATPDTTLEFRFAPSDAPIGQVTGTGIWTSVDTGPGTSAQSRHNTRNQATPDFTDSEKKLDPSVDPTKSNNQAWVKHNGLQPHVWAAVQFVKSAGFGIRGATSGAVVKNVAGTDKPSDHATGHATDIYTSAAIGTAAAGHWVGVGNSVAKFFVENPLVFGTQYVIWAGRINQGKGWKIYHHPTVKQRGGCNTLPHSASCRGSLSEREWVKWQHFDHVHVSFKGSPARGQTNPTQAGPMGHSWPGSSDSDFGNNLANYDTTATWSTGGGQTVYSGIVGVDGLPLVNAWEWMPGADPESSQLTGHRAMMNDSPILETIQELMRASQRSYMAAPNGDFIGWFPDYFGAYGTAAKMVIRDIELANDGFTIQWSDEKLITHQYVAGSWYTHSASEVIGGPIVLENKINTAGVATVEMKELMESLFNIKGTDPRSRMLRDAQAIYERFGARVNYQGLRTINGPEAEFWTAVSLFQKNWASQFSSQVDLTFMPELWPGMLIFLEGHDFQAYVTNVTHRFNFRSGGFTTTVGVIAPSTSKGGGFYGMAVGDNMQKPTLVTVGGGGGGSFFTV